jgi:hypothetical protein
MDVFERHYEGGIKKQSEDKKIAALNAVEQNGIGGVRNAI